MPHIHLEYSDNIAALQPRKILRAMNQAMLDGGYVTAATDIKSRAICQSDYVIGLEDESQSYIHARVSLLTGRDVQTRKNISAMMLEVLQEHLAPQQKLSVQLCVEIIEMEKETYSKVIL